MVAHTCTGWLHNPCRLGGPQPFRVGGRLRSDHKVSWVATIPLPSEGPHCFRAGGGKMGSGPQVGRVAT